MLEDTFHGFLEIDKIGKTDESTKSYFLSFLWIFLDRIIVTAPSIPHFKGLGTRNLLYELSIYEKINNKATMIMLSYFDFCWLTRYCNSGPPREVRQARFWEINVVLAVSPCLWCGQHCAGLVCEKYTVACPSNWDPGTLLCELTINSIYSCNNITTTLIQISRLFYFGFFPKLTIRWWSN